MRGRLITFEGPEGSGKTTQAARLAEWLRSRGCEVVTVREPGGTAVGEEIRRLLQHAELDAPPAPEAEALLFAASRAQLVRTVILPALVRGASVVCDRYMDSTTAYQGGGRGFDLAQVAAINAFAVNGAAPDLTVLLDLAAEEGLARVQRRGAAFDRMERAGPEFHARVRAGYLALAAREPGRFLVLDARRTPDEVAARIRERVAALLAAPARAGATAGGGEVTS